VLPAGVRQILAQGKALNSQCQTSFLGLRLAEEEAMGQECHCDKKRAALLYGFVLILGFNVLPAFTLKGGTKQ
jgi:hypothetical protein